MNIVKELWDYRHSLERIEMLETEINFIEGNGVMKVTAYTDDIPGKKKSLYDKYDKVLQDKQEFKMELFLEKKKVAVINKAFDILNTTHPKESNALRLRYIENRSLIYVSQQIGYSESQTRRILRSGQNELRKLLLNIKR